MSAELERIKTLLDENLVDAAFDHDDKEYSYYLVRVRKTNEAQAQKQEQAQLLNDMSPLMDETFDHLKRSETVRKNIEDYDPSFLFENASLLEKNKDFVLARNIYHALIRKGHQIPQALAKIAKTYELENNLEESIQYYEEAIAYSSELKFYQDLAAVYIKLGRDSDAIRTLTHSLGLPEIDSSQKFEIHKSLGNCYTRTGDTSQAEFHYRKAYDLNTNSDILQVNVGSLALQKGDTTSAQEHFCKALELNPNNAKAYSGLGLSELNQNSFEKAHDYFLRSLELNLNNLGAIYNLIKCAYELKKFENTTSILQRYLDSNSSNLNIHYSYAGILYHRGTPDAALVEANKILEINPNHTGAKELIELISKAKH